jgi:16S rRNA (guanine527-N7)-methyltransferase
MTGAELLSRGSVRLGLALDEVALERCARYQQLLAQWGARINLTAVREPRDVVIRHFLDSLVVAARLPGAAALPAPTLVDVGSGAGFPGAVCALARPDLAVTLCERIGKKAAFLLALRRELGLRYEVVAGDASTLPGGYGIAVARAALQLPDWLRLGAHLVAPSGFVVAMTGPREPLPTLPAGCELTHDEIYDVGAGPHRLLILQRAAQAR